jgi:hypothetical protein
MCILWASEHRNVLTEIADQCDVTPQFVHMVLYRYRKSKDGKVERALRERGAPLSWK